LQLPKVLPSESSSFVCGITNLIQVLDWYWSRLFEVINFIINKTDPLEHNGPNYMNDLSHTNRLVTGLHFFYINSQLSIWWDKKFSPLPPSKTLFPSKFQFCSWIKTLKCVFFF
jgi:hypothetical protein